MKSVKPSEQIGSKALTGKTYCDKLFTVERSMTDCSPSKRYERRLELSKPILEDFFSWLKKCNAFPQIALGKAVHYTLGQWKYLENYLLEADER